MKDKTGVKDTCPFINEIIGILSDSQKHENHITYSEFKDAEALLEDIRQMNSELRQMANEYIEMSEDLEKEVNNLEKEIAYLKAEVKGLEDRLEPHETN